MPNKHTPYHPVIYVRGFAYTQGEIEDTVADPYMGFNAGSTKSRRVWDGSMRRFFFESPLVRLKDEIVWQQSDQGPVRTDRRYDDVYVNGEDLTAASPDDPKKPFRSDITLPYQSIAVFRYYDAASADFGGDKKEHPIEEFAKSLSDLILRLRSLVCKAGGMDPHTDEKGADNGVSEEEFRVYLVAHSMGGLVCRAFLQNKALGDDAARKAVDKVFTYATPHNGIDLRVVRNVPGWAALGEATNFNRERMAGYLGLPVQPDVSEVINFEPERIFNLVGTNPADYLTLKGLSSWAVGEVSDGLVRIDNATTFGRARNGKKIESPCSFAHRSHSGYYGIVNSEEGFQNLTRFLFGTVRADGFLDVEDVTLPADVQKAFDAGKAVRASYNFEVVVSVRNVQWEMHRRTVREHSAIQRKYDELFPLNTTTNKRGPSNENSPHLFSVFLDLNKSKHDSVAFGLDLAVLVPDYEIDGLLWMDQHYEGGYLFRELIIIEGIPDADAQGGWRVKYGYQSQTPNLASEEAELAASDGKLVFLIPVNSKAGQRPGIRATLRVELREWN